MTLKVTTGIDVDVDNGMGGFGRPVSRIDVAGKRDGTNGIAEVTGSYNGVLDAFEAILTTDYEFTDLDDASTQLAAAFKGINDLLGSPVGYVNQLTSGGSVTVQTCSGTTSVPGDTSTPYLVGTIDPTTVASGYRYNGTAKTLDIYSILSDGSESISMTQDVSSYPDATLVAALQPIFGMDFYDAMQDAISLSNGSWNLAYSYFDCGTDIGSTGIYGMLTGNTIEDYPDPILDTLAYNVVVITEAGPPPEPDPGWTFPTDDGDIEIEEPTEMEPPETPDITEYAQWTTPLTDADLPSLATRLARFDVVAVMNRAGPLIEALLGNLADNGTEEGLTITLDLNGHKLVNLASVSEDPDEIVRKA